MLETPALEIVFALVAFQLAAFLYLYRRHRNEEHAASTTSTSTVTTSDRTAPSENEEPPVVECIDCGAENDPDYRYCWRCVSDLAGEPGPGRQHRSPSGRLF
ncbi:DUF7577 domain-containing protein [Halalkalicoccus salilacus]|uniref:DUF7577 domain-containing protein n=1 Tax=Halalkalicoccus salilacus TaxID=3117459 RepID=UPI00300F51E9